MYAGESNGGHLFCSPVFFQMQVEALIYQQKLICLLSLTYVQFHLIPVLIVHLPFLQPFLHLQLSRMQGIFFANDYYLIQPLSIAFETVFQPKTNRMGKATA